MSYRMTPSMTHTTTTPGKRSPLTSPSQFYKQTRVESVTMPLPAVMHFPTNNSSY